MKALRVLLLVTLAGLAGLAFAYLQFRDWLATPMSITAPGHVIEIPRGEALAVTADRLAQDGVLAHSSWLVWYARAKGIDARVQAGEYLVPAGATPADVLRQFERGAVVQHSITIVEGWNIRDLRRALAAEPLLVQTLGEVPDDGLMTQLGRKGLHPEGQFFPDTYAYRRGETDLEVLRRAHQRMTQELAQAWQDRAADLPLQSPSEVLILASIVEKETALASERPRIAGVFVQRLRRGMPLQTDPTVIYGLGAAFDGNLRRRDLEADGPYNTYRRGGLPPSPIAAPGAAALQAAAQPDERDELFFVATGLPDGSHAFSRTLREHEQAVAAYLRRLRARRLEAK